ncbi:hypothetical protein ACFWYW_55895 [Nonomuraea sp. NPDC059023]|uniref:hypothetical protein n=1 Tax=unclassified Nonomuraea TaxID=2593643 RepID=UPI003695D507
MAAVGLSLPTVGIEVMFDSVALIGVQRANSLDAGTNAATISTSNSGGASGNAFDAITGSPRFSNAQVFGGSGLSAFNPTSGADCHMDWSGVTQPGNTFCARFYMYLVSATSGTQRVFVLIGASGVTSAVWIFNNRTLRLYTGFSTAVVAQLTTPVPIGQWVRVEMRWTIDVSGNGTGEIWLYTNPNSTTHTDYAISSVVAWPNGKPGGAEWHLQRDAGGYWHTDLIAVAANKIGPAGTWTTLTAYGKRGISTRRGSSRIESPIIRYEAGTASAWLNNTDRRFDPTHLSGPYVSGGRSQVTPMKPIRFRATWNSVTYDVFRGFVDQWDVIHVADVYSEVRVLATDGFKILRNRRRPAVTPVGAGENTGARITRILNSAGWPAADRLIATGNSTLQATDLEGVALDELQTATESEIGELYIDASGRVVFRNRQAALMETRSNTVQATFGQTVGVPAPVQAKVVTDDATMWNEIKVKRTGGTELLIGDEASQVEYQVRTFQPPELLIQTDTEVEAYAGWILYVSKDPEVRFSTVEIHAHADPDTLFPIVLAREIGDRIRIVRRPSGGGAPIERDVFIRGIAHETTGATWITTWTLQSATKYGSFFTLDNPVLGLLDNNALGY